MTLTDLAAVRNGIASNLAAAFPNMQISPYLLSNPSLPCIYLVPAGIDYHAAMGDALDKVHLIARLLTAYNLDIPGQQELDEMCQAKGATSVVAAIESDPTLGGAVQYVYVSKVSAPKLMQTPGQPDALAVEFTIEGMA